MGLFGDEEGVPDVGQEESVVKKPKKKGLIDSIKNFAGKKPDKEETPTEAEEVENPGIADGVTEVVPEPEPEPSASDADRKSSKKRQSLDSSSLESANSGFSNFEVERLSAKLDAMDALIRGYGERFSTMSQQIGEVRAMTLGNEKEISKAIEKSEMAADIVKEVEPEKLRVDYQKIDLKIASLSERIEANKQFSDTVLEQVKDLKRRADVFVGTEGVLSLNEEVKKDLIQLQQLSGRVRMHADKAEELFMELKRGFAENQKLNEVVTNLDANYSEFRKDLEKTRMDFSNIVSDSDFESFKKTVNNKFTVLEESANHIEKIKEEIERVAQLIETVAGVARKNKEDIADIAVTIGDDKIQRVSDYENQITSILSIIDNLAGQITLIKKKVGIKEKKIVVKHDENVVSDGKVNLGNMDVHPTISENLAVKPADNAGLENITNPSEESAQQDKKIDELIKKAPHRVKHKKDVKKAAKKKILKVKKSKKKNKQVKSFKKKK